MRGAFWRIALVGRICLGGIVLVFDRRIVIRVFNALRRAAGTRIHLQLARSTNFSLYIVDRVSQEIDFIGSEIRPLLATFPGLQ